MSVNVSEFNLGLDKWKGLTRTQSVLAQRKVTLQILRGCIRGTPVDTGRLRGAWVASVGAPNMAEPNRGAIPAAGTGAIGEAGTSLATLQFGQPSFVTNAVEYAGHCNNTHPTKAHWVEGTLANVAAQFGGSL
jgi:hypothetical protein